MGRKIGAIWPDEHNIIPPEWINISGPIQGPINNWLRNGFAKLSQQTHFSAGKDCKYSLQ